MLIVVFGYNFQFWGDGGFFQPVLGYLFALELIVFRSCHFNQELIFNIFLEQILKENIFVFIKVNPANSTCALSYRPIRDKTNFGLIFRHHRPTC